LITYLPKLTIAVQIVANLNPQNYSQQLAHCLSLRQGRRMSNVTYTLAKPTCMG